jgi:hypothetical protein
MDDLGNYTVTRPDGRGGTTDVSAGMWSYWHGSFVWLDNDGKTWPPETSPIVSDEPGQITLLEHDGSTSAFQRANIMESHVCNTKGVPNPNAPSEPAEGAVDMSTMLEKAQTAPALADFAGTYAASGKLTDDSTLQLTVDKDGATKATLLCSDKAGGANKQETGTLDADHEWYELGAVSVNAVDTCRLPAHFYPLMWGGQHYLLSESALAYVVNQYNAGATVDTGMLLRRGDGDAKAVWPTNKPVILPKPYAEGLLKAPVKGHISAIGGVGATSPAELLKPPPEGVEYAANAAVDMGARAGVFVGMQLYTGDTPNGMHIVVTKVLLDSASVRMSWRGDWRPGPTLDASTHP